MPRKRSRPKQDNGGHYQGPRKRICRKTVIEYNYPDIGYPDLDENGTISPPDSPLRSSTPQPDEPMEQYMERNGLGRAVDSTKASPWKNKTPHQLQRVESGSFTEDNDGNSVESFSLLIETQKALQMKFEGSVTAPKVPIRAGIAADFCRSTHSRMLAKGKRIHRRTITMKRAETCSDFEEKLRSKLDGCKEPVKRCREILESDYGGATHYISSITLGAMEFSKEECSGKKLSASVGGSLGVDSLVSLESKVGGESVRSESSTHQLTIGEIDEENHVLEEAVVQYALTPITDLVQDHSHREHVTEAIKSYMRDRRNKREGIHGPYIIQVKNKSRCYYWSIADDKNETKVITVTESKQDASSFFIEQASNGTGAHFLIVTSEDGKATEYPKKSPRYVYLISTKATSAEKGWRLEVHQLVQMKDNKSETVHFEIYDPKGKDSETIKPDWLPDEHDKTGIECYLKPQLKLKKMAFKRVINKAAAPYCLRFNFKHDELRVELHQPVISKKAMLFSLSM